MLEGKIPPVVIFSVAGMSMFALAGFDIHFDGVYLIFGGFCWLVAILIAMAAIWSFKKRQTTVNPHHLDKVTALVTTGVFKYSRNPMYLSLAITLIGWSIILGAIWTIAFVILFILYLTQFQIKPEERMLHKKFGLAYESYCSKVRRWL